MVHAWTLSTWEAVAGGSQVQGQPWLHSHTLSQRKRSFYMDPQLNQYADAIVSVKVDHSGPSLAFFTGPVLSIWSQKDQKDGHLSLVCPSSSAHSWETPGLSRTYLRSGNRSGTRQDSDLLLNFLKLNQSRGLFFFTYNSRNKERIQKSWSCSWNLCASVVRL